MLSAMDAIDNFHRNMFAYRTIKNDNNQVGYLTDNYLANFYNGSSNSNHALMANTLDAISAHNISAAQANVSAMQPGTAVEQDFKTVQTIALYKMADSTYHFTAVDSVTLSVIASKCVFEGGIAVTQARALLAAITQSPVFYIDNCVSYGSTSQRTAEVESKIEISENSFVKLYPNPNSGSFIIEYKLESDAVIEVRDVQGKLVCKNILMANQTASTITCENLENGVYLYKVVSDGYQAPTKKLVIVK